MPVTSIADYNNKSSKAKSFAITALMYLAGIIGIGLTVYFGGEIIRNIKNIKGKAGLSIQSTYAQYDVYVNDKIIGKTPFESTDVKPGLNKVALKSDTRLYETTVNFLPSTVVKQSKDKYIYTVGIFRDLGTSDIFSSGQELWFEKDNSGNVLRVLSEPSGASVFIDNVEVGKTPFSSNNMSEGEYDLKIDLKSCESQTMRINIRKGLTLNVSSKLFPMPVPTKVTAFQGSPSFYNLSADIPLITSDTKAWAEAVKYWIKTRGINIDDKTGLKDYSFDYYVDYKGNVFDKDIVQIGSAEEFAKLKGAKSGAYLGRVSDGDGLTKEASEIVQVLLGGAISSGKSVKVKQTPTGWLRVRNDASLNGVEIARVNVGSVYPVVEEKTGWVKIKVSDTVEGWVSADYTQNQ